MGGGSANTEVPVGDACAPATTVGCFRSDLDGQRWPALGAGGRHVRGSSGTAPAWGQEGVAHAWLLGSGLRACDHAGGSTKASDRSPGQRDGSHRPCVIVGTRGSSASPGCCCGHLCVPRTFVSFRLSRRRGPAEAPRRGSRLPPLFSQLPGHVDVTRLSARVAVRSGTAPSAGILSGTWRGLRGRVRRVPGRSARLQLCAGSRGRVSVTGT